MKNNPLIDVLAILFFLLVVIVVGHYMKVNKEKSLQQIEEKVVVQKRVCPTFECLSKATE